MTSLFSKLARLAAFLDAQSGPAQVAFQYCLCLIMVEAGRIELVETIPGENGVLCTFRTIAGDVFSIAKPAISKEQEATLIEQLRVILDEEGDCWPFLFKLPCQATR